MGEIKFPGLATGIDTGAIIQQLMEVNRRRLYKYQEQTSSVEAKSSAIDELQTKLKTLRSSYNSLSDSSTLMSYKSASSDEDALTIDATSSAIEGNHSVQVKQLATAERLVHTGFERESSLVDPSDTGSFIITYDKQQFIITTDAETTLADLVGLINEDPDNPGIGASILEHDSGDGLEAHLVLSGQDSGSDYNLTINAQNSHILKSDTDLNYGSDAATITTRLSFLEGFTGTVGGGDTITISGTDNAGAAITTVNMAITEYTTIEDLVDEIEKAYSANGTGDVYASYSNGKITVMDATEGASALTLDLNLVSGTATFDLPSFGVEATGGSLVSSNAALEAADFTWTQYAQDSLIKVDDYPPGDTAADWIKRSTNTIDDVISGVTLKLHDTTGDGISTVAADYSKIEVNLTRNTDTMKEDIEELVANYNEVVDFLQANTVFNQETKVAGLLSSEYSVTSLKNSLKTFFTYSATGFSDDDSFAIATNIGFEIDPYGKLQFDSSEFDEAVTEDYRGVIALLGANKTGSTDNADISFYALGENTTEAGEYETKVWLDGGTYYAQMRKAGESEWHDAVVDDVNYTITGGKDSSDKAYPEFNLTLSFDETQLIDGGAALTANVTVRQGFAGSAKDAIDNVLDYETGGLTLTKNSMTSNIDRMYKSIEREEDRLVKVEDRLVMKYARLEMLLASMQRQMGALGMA